MSAVAQPHFDDARARRNAMVLAVSQAFYGSSTTMLVATAGLVGAGLAESPGLATLPVSTFVIGTALTTLPMSFLMRRFGRRAGFLLGALAGVAAALLGVYAIYVQSFALFAIATMGQGVYQASSSYYRFAAADLASPAFRPKAISWVLTGGVVAALIGTLLVMKTTDLLAPVAFAGVYATMALLGAGNLVALALLDSPRTEEHHSDGPARPLAEIAVQPRYIVAVGLAMLSYGMMNLVMTATPVAMLGCGFHVQDSSWVIQWHALAMYVPSFATGTIIARYGTERVAALGMALLVGAAIAGLLGIRFENFAVGLILLGLGWNFGFIGATTLLTTTYRAAERAKAQGLNDFLVFATTAGASLAAGTLLAGWGWNAVNYAVLPMSALGLVLIGWLLTHRRAHAA